MHPLRLAAQRSTTPMHYWHIAKHKHAQLSACTSSGPASGAVPESCQCCACLQLPLEDPFIEAVAEPAQQLPGTRLPTTDAANGAAICLPPSSAVWTPLQRRVTIPRQSMLRLSASATNQTESELLCDRCGGGGGAIAIHRRGQPRHGAGCIPDSDGLAEDCGGSGTAGARGEPLETFAVKLSPHQHWVFKTQGVYSQLRQMSTV